MSALAQIMTANQLKEQRNSIMKQNAEQKIISKDPPYYLVDGKGWKINQCLTHPELGVVYVRKQWFRTKVEAKAAYPSVLDDAIKKKASQSSEMRYSRQLLSWEQFKEEWKKERLTQVRGNTWKSKDFPMVRKYFDPLWKGMTVKDCFTEAQARKLKKAIAEARTQFGDAVPMVDKNRAIAFYLAMLDFAYENDFMVDSDEYRHCKAVMKKMKVSDETECGHKRPPISLNLNQVNLILLNIDYLSTDYMLTKILFHCGFRVGEALALKVENIDFESMQIDMSHILAPDENGEVKRFKRAKTKNGIRRIPIIEGFGNELKAYIAKHMLRGSDYLFPGFKPDKPLDRTAYAKRLAKYCKLAGVPVVTPHAARHTFSTNAHELGYRPEVIAMVLGHTTMIDVNVYNHLADLAKAKVMLAEMFAETHKA